MSYVTARASVHSLLVVVSVRRRPLLICLCFYLRMDDYLEDIGAEVEINFVEVEYYDSSAAMPPVVKPGKTKVLFNDEKN